MVSDSSSPCQGESERVERAETLAPVPRSEPGLRFEWSGRVFTGASGCDAKTLAARRKRTEIRRLRLMAAALGDNDDDDDEGEPFQKRTKTSGAKKRGDCEWRKPGFTIYPRVTGTTTHTPVSAGQKPSMHAGSNMSGTIHTDAPGQSVQTIDESGDGGSTVESRLGMSGRKRVLPSHCVMSICGRSREMEDAAIAVPSFLSMPSPIPGQRRTDTFHFYGVYDGHGGPQAAEFCKEKMHRILADELSAAGDNLSGQWEACFQSCFGKLDAELCGFCPHGTNCPRKRTVISSGVSSSCREPLVPGSVGTTAVVAVVGEQHIIVGNCGDSRAVLSRGGQVVPLSLDHKANRPDEVARIEAAGGHVFTWQGHRVCGVLAMSRALGDGFLKPFVSGQPEVTVTARSDDDECLILASDGLWDALSNEFVCNVAQKALANWRGHHSDFKRDNESEQVFPTCSNADMEEDSPAQVVAALLTKLALAKHSKDNISVIVVDLKQL